MGYKVNRGSGKSGSGKSGFYYKVQRTSKIVNTFLPLLPLICKCQSLAGLNNLYHPPPTVLATVDGGKAGTVAVAGGEAGTVDGDRWVGRYNRRWRGWYHGR